MQKRSFFCDLWSVFAHVFSTRANLLDQKEVFT